jgi:hypothetical protein
MLLIEDEAAVQQLVCPIVHIPCIVTASSFAAAAAAAAWGIDTSSYM